MSAKYVFAGLVAVPVIMIGSKIVRMNAIEDYEKHLDMHRRGQFSYKSTILHKYHLDQLRKLADAK